MPEEVEVPLEHAQEHIQEAHKERHGEGGEAGEKEKDGWTRLIAVFTAILAVVAAIGALQSGLLVNEALLQKNEQVSRLTQASDQWNYYQAKGIKGLIRETAAQGLSPGSPAAQLDLKEAARYKAQQDDIQKKAEGLEEQSKKSSEAAEAFLHQHHVFAVSVTLCQIAIALSAVAALTRRRYIWLLGMASGAIGTVLLLYGFFGRH